VEETILLEIEKNAFNKSVMEGNKVALQVLANTARVVSQRLRTTDSRLVVLYEKGIEMKKKLEELESDFVSALSRALLTPLVDSIREESKTDKDAV
jgi:hypothetical protein